MRKKLRSAYLLESLEARLLFSADLAPLPVDGGATGTEFESSLEISLQPDSTGVQEAGENTQERQEVIFVDSGVDDYQQLIDDIESQLEKGRQFDIVNLDSDSNGIDQISAYLKQHEGIDAVHVVSHGSQDAVKLGNVWLTADTLDTYADAVEGWQQALSSDADLLFYGCNLAAGDGGQDLVNSLTLLTGADVAASDDVTGSAQFGGDWVLEYKSGQIEASVPFSVDLQSNWSGLLNTFTVTTMADGGAGSLRQAIIDANALGGANEIILNPGTYTLSLGELVITSDLTINGADARTTLIVGDGSNRVFKIDNNSTATLNGITIMNGNQHNSGGVFVENGSTLELSDAIVRDNTSDMGGGIHVHGTANLERVLLYNNTANEGGAIHFHDTADGSLTNVTISNNSATSEGGGLWTNVPITVTNSTIAYNTAPAGGGVFDTDGLEITLNNSILYNPGSTNSNDDLISGDYNIDSDGTAGLGLGNDRVVNPFIAPLADNGGTTPTHALQATSVDAIDRVGLGGAPSLDGRGAARDGSPDIGAYEYRAKTTGTVGEFLVNDGNESSVQETSGELDHSQRAVAVADDGSYVVVWSSDNQDASGWGVYAQRFSKLGVELTGELLVNEVEAGNERWARVVSDGSGNFVVTWTSNHSGTIDVYARRFASSGTALGGEFRVNTTTSNDQKDSSIAMDAFGNFVVVWEGQGASDSAGVFYRRFYANGTAMDATEQQANPSDNGTEEDASVAMNTAGDFVVVWIEDDLIKYRLFDKDGTQVATNTVYLGPHASSPDVAMDALGNFVVVYRWNDPSGGKGTWGHKFDNTGLEQLPWFRVGPGINNWDNKDHDNPSITMDDLGNFIVTYESVTEGEPGNKTVFAERFLSDKTSLGRFQVNQTTAGDQHMASIAMLDLDNYVVAFTGDDANQTGVFARQYGTAVNTAPTATNLTSTSSYNEGDATVAITDIVVSDADAGETITATLTLNDTAAGSLSANDGATYDGGTGVWTITDTVANINLALVNLVFTPLVDNDVDTTISSHIEDAAGAGPADGTITLDVTPVNDVPVATGNTVIASEDVPLVIGPGDFNFTDVEGDSLASVTITGLNLNGGILTHSAGAVTVTNGMTITAAQLADLTFTSALNDSTDCSFTYTVNDAGTGVTSAVMNITVNAVNDVPVATGNTVIASEDVPLVIGPGDFNFTDVEGDSLASVTITGLNVNGGTLTHSAGTVTVTNGMTITAAQLADLTFTSALNDSTNSSFTYTVNDAGTGVTSAVMNITVNAVNDVPVATGNTVIADEDVPLVIGASDFNFTDIESDALASVTITGLNLNGGTLTHSGGAVTVTNGMTITAAQLADLTFTSALNDSTDCSFTYTVNDAGTGVTSAVMNITVNAVNDVPVATGNTVIASEDVPLVIGASDFNFTDVEGDSLASVTITGLNLNGGTLTHSAGAVTVTNGMTITAAELADLTFTSALNDSTDSSFTYTVNDAGTGVTSAVMNITVNAVNDVPVATGNTVIANEDVSLVIGASDFNFTDIESDALASVTITGLNLNGGTLTHSAGAVTVTNGMTITAAQLADLTFTSALNDSTDCSFTYTVNDAGTGVTLAVMNITVNAVNDVPVATGNTVIASEDLPLVIGPGDFNFTDVEGDSLDSVTISGLNLNGGTLTHSAGTVTVTNGMTITAAQLADLTFTSALNDSTDCSFTYTVNDAGTGVTSAVMNITVNAVNDVPVATGNTVIASEDVPLVIGPGNFNFTDVEGDSLDSVTISGLNLNGGTLTHSAGVVTVTNGMTITAAELADLTFTSALNDSTDCSFTYTVNDAGTGVTSAVMNITVNAVNDVPVATGNTVIASEDVPLVIGPGDFDFTDVEGDSLASVTITGLNLNGGTLTHSAGAVTVTNGMTITAAQLADLTFTSALNDSTDCSFTYTVNDAGTGVTSAVMNITVNAVNDVPVATGNTVIASEDVPLMIGPGDFNFTDTEGDSLVSVTITGLNLNGGTLTHSAGAVTVTNGMTVTAAQLADLTFTSALNDSTDCSFTYTVNDAGTGVTSAVMYITVNAVNDAGTVTIDNTTPTQGDTLTANVIDPDGISGAITYQWFSDGAVIGGANGKTYTTTQTDVGAVMTVTAIYTDDQSTAESLTSAPTAPVTNVNDTPIAVNDNLNAIEDQSMTFTSVTDLLGNDSDIDGDTLTISSYSQPANGSLADNGDGTVTYTSAGNFSGVDSFTYTISDNKGGTATGAAIIVVTPVGDTPQVTNVSTNAEVQSGLINIDRNANDGAEVTHFKISGITNGTLYLADGVSRIDNGDFISVGQGQAGLRFTPAANSTADGSFNVESSEDGVSVASQSGIATSTISILTTAPQPSEPVPSPPPSVPEEVVSEETEQEESEDLEDVAEETDVQADTTDLVSVETPQSSKAPGIKKASMVPGLTVLRRADLTSNDDRTPGRSTLFAPQTLKKLIESENLGELKTALGKLDITTLPPDVYALVRGSLDAVQEEMGKEILIGKTVVGSAIATSVGLSAGYVVWMLKGGSLLASVLSSLPAWQLADPLAILVGKKEDEDEDDDTLETIIKDGSRRNEDKKRNASELDKHKKESTKR